MKPIAVLLACALASGCTEWKVASLEPQRFTPATSPGRVRLTMTGGAQLTARHPVMVGDSLAWMEDSVRSVVPLSSVQLVEVHRYNPTAVIIVSALLVGAASWFLSWLGSGE
jgi:hypothetical protein